MVPARRGFRNDLGDIGIDLAVREVDIDLAELLRARPHDLVFGRDPHVDEDFFERLAARFRGFESSLQLLVVEMPLLNEHFGEFFVNEIQQSRVLGTMKGQSAEALNYCSSENGSPRCNDYGVRVMRVTLTGWLLAWGERRHGGMGRSPERRPTP